MKPLYIKLFPDFDTVPAMADWEGKTRWYDSSYGNDACPSFACNELIPGVLVKVFTDYDSIEKRDTVSGHQYVVISEDEDTGHSELLYGCDYLVELYQFISDREKQYNCLTDDDRAAIGEQWAEYFNLKRSADYPDRWDMVGGNKTALGVYRTIRHLVRSNGDGFNNEGKQ